MNQAGKHHSAILLDEAPTLYIPKLEIIPATARSNKEFNTRFKNISCEPVSMPERNFLFDVESNFRAVHAQIKELVQ